MSVGMDNRRAVYAIVCVENIGDKDTAQTRKVQAAKTIALIRNAGLLKAITFISGNSNMKEIYRDVVGWLAKAKDKDGPQLPQEVKQSAAPDRIVSYIAGMESRLDYVRLSREVIAILEHIKLMAEGHKNFLASRSEAPAGDSHA